MTVRHIFEISEDDHPHTVSHARDHWWTLDFANALVSPGVNSRGELVPSHSASRRQLGDKYGKMFYISLIILKAQRNIKKDIFHPDIELDQHVS
jgi:hypothetical protein